MGTWVVFASASLTCTLLLSLQSLSAAQLESFGPDNAEIATSEQKAALREEQLAALERAMSGSYKKTSTPDKSGKKLHGCQLTAHSEETFASNYSVILIQVHHH